MRIINAGLKTRKANFLGMVFKENDSYYTTSVGTTWGSARKEHIRHGQ